MTEDRIKRMPQQEQGAQREGGVLGESRKGMFLQPEVPLPPDFVLPSVALTRPPVEQVATTPPASGQQANTPQE